MWRSRRVLAAEPHSYSIAQHGTAHRPSECWTTNKTIAEERRTRKQRQGRKNMFCAYEIPSRDPCPGRSQVTWTSGLLQAPGTESHPALHVQPSLSRCVWPLPPSVLLMHVVGPWRSLCRHWILFRVLGVVWLFVCLFAVLSKISFLGFFFF